MGALFYDCLQKSVEFGPLSVELMFSGVFFAQSPENTCIAAFHVLYLVL
jgi:hypothetical protein